MLLPLLLLYLFHSATACTNITDVPEYQKATPRTNSLMLAHLHLCPLPVNAFAHLTSLNILFLDDNQFTSLLSGIFSNNTALDDLVVTIGHLQHEHGTWSFVAGYKQVHLGIIGHQKYDIFNTGSS